MELSATELIRQHSSRSNDAHYNFSSSSGIKTTFGVSTDKMPSFLSSYCALAFEDEDNADSKNPTKRLYNLAISEQLTKKNCPIVVSHFFQFNLSKEETEGDDVINAKFKSSLVYSYQEAIKDCFKIGQELRELVTVVLETDPWFCKNTACFNVELRFPYCLADISFQKNKFKQVSIEKLLNNNVLKYLDVQPKGDWERIIQENGDCLPLYRSVIDLSVPPYRLNNIFGVMKCINDETAEMELSEVFNPKDHSYIHAGEIDGDFLEEHKDLERWLPLFLSAYFWTKPASIKKASETDDKLDLEYDDENEDPLVMAAIFLDIIRVETVLKESFWMDIGRALFNITQGSQEGLKVFIETSARCKSKNRNDKSCTAVWEKLRGSPLSIKTLAWFAKSDNKISYQVWHDKWVEDAMEMALDEMTDLDMAQLAYRYFWLDFACSGQEKNSWWYFTEDTHRFVPMDNAFKLRDGISKNLVPLLYTLRTELSKKQTNCGQNKKGKRKEKEIEVKLAQATKLIKLFKSSGPRNRIVSMCKEEFYIENFGRLINKNPNRTAWPNCVTEICNKQISVRNGKPEDYITKCGAARYRDDFSEDHPTIKEAREYIEQVFVDLDIRHYFYKDIASYLYGKNAEKHFRVWTGPKGDNSKSMMVKLMQFWWGEKCIDIPLSVYTGNSKYKGSGPNPEIAQMDSAALGITAEPDENGDLQIGAVKRGTGGDSQHGRSCGENGGSIAMTHKAIFMCNGVPNVPGIDEPGKGRFAFLLFLSKWINHPPDDPAERIKKRLFKKDPMFEERLPDLAEAIFWLAVKYFPLYSKEGLIPPQKIIDYAINHWKDNDPYEVFIDERLKKVKVPKNAEPSSAVGVTGSDLYPQFKIHFRAQNPQSTIPNIGQFKTQMTQRLGDPIKRYWMGYTIDDQVN